MGMVCGWPLHHTVLQAESLFDAKECLRLGLTSCVLADSGGITALHLCCADLTMDAGTLVL